MNTQIYTEASDWIVHNREGGHDASARKRFDAWLRASPEHVRAYLEMSAIWEDVSALAPDWNPVADELIAGAGVGGDVVFLDAADANGRTLSEHPGSGDVVAPLQSEQACRRPRSRSTVAWRSIRIALAASVLLACAGVAAWFHLQRGLYATGVGEQRLILLGDGSTLELNASSRVRVRFTGAERNIDLLEGQALFRVAKDAVRPFTVHSRSARVRALGTQFDVYRKPGRTIVTVLEGSVAVLPVAVSSGAEQGDAVRKVIEIQPGERSGMAPAIYLQAGEQLTVMPDAVQRPSRPDVAAATAWTQRRLVFDSARLADVAEEFNRYNARRLVIETPQLADFRVSGVFSSVDPQLLLRFLGSQPEIVIQSTDEEIRISKN